MAHVPENSFIVTIIITVGQVVTAILAGYAFAFLEFPFKRTLFVVFLATLMVPFEVTIVTNVTTINDLGWYNTYPGLAVPFLATGFGAFLHAPGVPQVAARPPGRRRARRLRALAVPDRGSRCRSRGPAVAALTRVRVPRRLEPVPLAAARHQGRPAAARCRSGSSSCARRASTRSTSPSPGVIIAALPLVILLLVFQKQLVRGLTAGAVKG